MNFRLLLCALLCLSLFSPASSFADYESWLTGFRGKALAEGIRAELFDRVFKDIVVQPRVIEQDRNQPSRVYTFVEYRDRLLSPLRIERTIAAFNDHRELLEQVSGRYGVEPEILVALWSIESDLGRFTGRYPLFASLATLAFEGRRGPFFEKELLSALKIISLRLTPEENLMSSWAGAMGQVQFMPSTFLGYAEDFDGDGFKDIWKNDGDALASAANYLAASGWEKAQGWAVEVLLTEKPDPNLMGLEISRPVKFWKERGVAPGTPGALPAHGSASLILPDGEEGPAYLVFDNFRVIRKWNRSSSFALSVGRLADLVRADAQRNTIETGGN